MDIIVSANNNEEILVFPVIQDEIPIEDSQNNEVFETINTGPLNIIGDIGLRTVPISSIFPVHEYKWMRPGSSSNGWDYVNFFKKWRAAKVPIRIIMCEDDGLEILNMPCTIDLFRYQRMRNGDIRYSLDLKEYQFVKVVQSG